MDKIAPNDVLKYFNCLVSGQESKGVIFISLDFVRIDHIEAAFKVSKIKISADLIKKLFLLSDRLSYDEFRTFIN